MAYINIHVDLSDIYDDLTSSDKMELVEWLTCDGYIEPESLETSESLQNEEFNEACKKLASSYYRLSQEDEKIIIDLIKKYN